MLTFRQFIYLTEAKLSDIIKGHVNKGHPPEEVNDVITRAQTAKKQGAKINIGMPFNHVKNAVEQHEQKQASKSDIQTIHHDPKTGVTIKQVNTKDACIKGYGGGKTNWCVAATGSDTAFDEYSEGGNKMFTIHHKNPETGKETIYGAHEYQGSIHDINNQSVKPHDDVYKAMAETPQLRRINITSGNPHATENHITDALKDHTNGFVAGAALRYHKDKITPHHIDMAFQHPERDVLEIALKHHKDKIQPHHIYMAKKRGII